MKIHSVAKIITAGLLIWALGPHSYDYYVLLRWVVCSVAAYSAYVEFQRDRPMWGWTFVILAVLFNPVIPFYFSRDTWRAFDLVSAGVMIVSLVVGKTRRPVLQHNFSDDTIEEGKEFMVGIREGDGEAEDVALTFHNYCREYLTRRTSLTKDQASLLLLDPELGPEMDEAKRKWAFDDLGSGVDVDEFLIPPQFDAPEMSRINNLLDRYAHVYPAREQKIIRYLKEIGYL